jgi:FkbM family methyltransferase
MKRIIYDFGANTGSDIPYYLKKADVVVAVEANPTLCKSIESRFNGDLSAGRLHVENCVLTDGIETEVDFYIDKRAHGGSRFPKPNDRDIDKFDKVKLPSLSPATLIERYGEPFYIKIDVEFYDRAILRALFLNNIYPKFISAEAHSIDIFALLVASGRYDAFKLVEGSNVAQKYNKMPFTSKDGVREVYSFPDDSAGPFGEDIHGEWMSADNFFVLLALEGLGWKDIHATNVSEDKISSTRWKKLHISAYLFKRLQSKLKRAFS